MICNIRLLHYWAKCVFFPIVLLTVFDNCVSVWIGQGDPFIYINKTLVHIFYAMAYIASTSIWKNHIHYYELPPSSVAMGSDYYYQIHLCGSQIFRCFSKTNRHILAGIYIRYWWVPVWSRRGSKPIFVQFHQYLLDWNKNYTNWKLSVSFIQ